MNTKDNDQELSLEPSLGMDDVQIPSGVDRRAFMMRSALVGAVAVLNGCAPATPPQTALRPPRHPRLCPNRHVPDLNVVKKAKGPVMTTIDEFYKVGPGPSSSHTIGPMRITYDFYQRCTKLPADQLAKATALKVHLFGSLSATGKGHGTERAALAGIIGKEPATIDPVFLDELAAKPDQTFPVKLGTATFNASLKDIIYDAPKGDFPHPNTMTCKLMAGDTVLLEQEYYSVGGGFIEWKGYEPPKKGAAEIPVRDDEGTAGARGDRTSCRSRSWRWPTKWPSPARARRRSTPSSTRSRRRWSTSSSRARARRRARCPGRSSSRPRPATSTSAPWTTSTRRSAASAWSSAYALAGSEENARGHLVVTAPTGGSAGVMPALVYALGEGGRKLPQEKIRDGLLAAAAIGYLCKHNATLAGRRRRLPGGDRRRVGDGRGLHRRRRTTSTTRWSPTPPSRRWSITLA